METKLKEYGEKMEQMEGKINKILHTHEKTFQIVQVSRIFYIALITSDITLPYHTSMIYVYNIYIVACTYTL